MPDIFSNKEPEAWWFCFGDFNAVRSSEERLGTTFCQNTAFYFNNFIHEAGLVELSLGGRRFTYMSSNCEKHSKLDRFLVSHGALMDWPDLQATALNRLYSDHCPLFLSSSKLDFGPSPFRFFNRWLLDPTFSNLVLETWHRGGSLGYVKSLTPLSILAGKLRCLKAAIRIWRSKIAEGEKNETTELKKKIEAIDLDAETTQPGLETLEIRADAMQKLKQIEEGRLNDLRQKSRAKWALEGDENSRFFQGLVNQHRRVLKISGLSDGGQWISDPTSLKNMAVKYFSKRFSDPVPCRPKFFSPGFKKLSDLQRRCLEEPISMDEIKNAVWCCGSNKAPGPDGYSIEFFRKFWDLVNSDLFMAVKSFERTGHIDKGCNASFITLVPKVADPVNLNNFRPISLISSIYKVISKILAERLKKVIPSVVSEVQTAFISGRSILELFSSK